MLAALLLNLGGTPPPPQPPAEVRRPGGGPFWRRYGYDSAYDAIRDSTTTDALPSIDEHPAAVVGRAVPQRPQINYKLLDIRVEEAVAKDMQMFRAKRAQEALDDEETEAILIFLLGD